MQSHFACTFKIPLKATENPQNSIGFSDSSNLNGNTILFHDLPWIGFGLGSRLEKAVDFLQKREDDFCHAGTMKIEFFTTHR
jgi:hypothetical protein